MMSLLGVVDIVTIIPVFVVLATGESNNPPTGFVRFYRVLMLSKVSHVISLCFFCGFRTLFELLFYTKVIRNKSTKEPSVSKRSI